MKSVVGPYLEGGAIVEGWVLMLTISTAMVLVSAAIVVVGRISYTGTLHSSVFGGNIIFLYCNYNDGLIIAIRIYICMFHSYDGLIIA